MSVLTGKGVAVHAETPQYAYNDTVSYGDVVKWVEIYRDGRVPIR